MKKCSTAAFWLSAALATLALPVAASQTCEFRAPTPDMHQVIPGDTLWDLAATFLDNPWCWPRVWEQNQEQVHNPHLIYPGQRIRLDRYRQRLGPELATETADERRSPSVRDLPTNHPSIPVIDPQWQRMSAQLRLVSMQEANRLPRVLGFGDRRRLAGPGDIALVEGRLQPGGARRPGYQILHRLPPVVDPDDGSLLAVPLQLAGSATYLHTEGALRHHFRIIDTRRELVPGDLIVPEAPEVVTAPLPEWHPPRLFEGKVAAVLSGGRWAAQHDLVALNRGRRDGLAPGKLVSVIQQVRIAADESQTLDPDPGQVFATLLVLDALERASLAFVLRGADAIAVGDRVVPARQEQQ